MKLSMLTKRIPFTLETEDGDVELFITQFSVGDAEYREKLMKDHWDNTDYVSKLNSFNLARIMTSIKTDIGDCYFTGSIDDVRSVLSMDIANALITEVDKLNPLPKSDETLDTKKKKS